MDGFTAVEVSTVETTLFVRWGGSGPPLLLLHGFPETHLMWRDIAPLLAREFTVVCADLRGYGQSACPPSTADHAPYAKRTMARDMIRVMEQFGFLEFAVAGHDRGGRVAHRMALDHPERVSGLAVLDIVPTEHVWTRADAKFALGFWPWSLLAQPAPLPERMLMAAADAIIDDALRNWGSSLPRFPSDVRQAYIQALESPEHAHAICEEYRAAATIDREHDSADRINNRRIDCPLLALWSRSGAVGTWFANEGGPLDIWRQWANRVHGQPIDAGHFFPEEVPELTASALRDFFRAPH